MEAYVPATVLGEDRSGRQVETDRSGKWANFEPPYISFLFPLFLGDMVSLHKYTFAFCYSKSTEKI